MSKKLATLPDISLDDQLEAYRERERNERKALQLVRQLEVKVEELRVESKAAKDLLEAAQSDLNIIVDRPLQIQLFTRGAPPAEPEEIHASDGKTRTSG